jgi:hypothetical protein
MNTVTKAKQKLDGKKTYITGGIAFTFEIVNELFPDLMSDKKEMMVQKLLFYLIYYGVLDKVWRDRKEIKDFIFNLFSKKKQRI